MTKMFLSMLLISISIFMFFLNHPFSMGLMILIQTLLMSLLSSMLINTYWFSYILFLIFLGGLLVLFIYVSSIASNELFKISMFNKSFFFFFFIIMLSSILFKNNLLWMNFFFNDEMINFFNLFLFFNNEFNINLSKLYNEQTYLLTMIMIIYLFITLIAVVKITNIFFGPLRSYE
uniref:NADH-ubiquinone oxidoreductase chain 6 n=1 Tax=Hestina assimilis TaxID=378390 RepID=A0A6B9VGE7_9NEOP|nr:NADH dehydrogenase subunit 6 [Hestina assimilis]QHN89101.1 NADH dehydrogenase subunit 6 [Hestina assimilis]UBA16608.1 NADH dehydrogenase subunit 6 [Hestinalis nama]USH57538.1 NADH dehydrogenase subunit 6 [Hestina assimilis]